MGTRNVTLAYDDYAKGYMGRYVTLADDDDAKWIWVPGMYRLLLVMMPRGSWVPGM